MVEQALYNRITRRVEVRLVVVPEIVYLNGTNYWLERSACNASSTDLSLIRDGYRVET